MKKKSLFILFFLLVLNIFAWKEVYKINKPYFLEAHFFDVGQGDASFIKTSSGHRILIDGGPNSLILEKLSKEIPPYDKVIDLIILTHPHSDHIRGLISVFENYEVKNIIWTGVIESANDFKRWQKIIEDRENVFYAIAGMRVHLGKTSLDILYPFDNLKGKTFKDSNNTSIAIKVNYGNNKLLFTGDSHKKVELELLGFEKFCKEKFLLKEVVAGREKILCNIVNLDSDIFHAGHHGSKTSNSEEFLLAVSPNIVIVSAGENNRHGHPHLEVLETFDKFNINVLRTDKMGDIKIIGDGINLKIISN